MGSGQRPWFETCWNELEKHLPRLKPATREQYLRAVLRYQRAHHIRRTYSRRIHAKRLAAIGKMGAKFGKLISAFREDPNGKKTIEQLPAHMAFLGWYPSNLIVQRFLSDLDFFSAYALLEADLLSRRTPGRGSPRKKPRGDFLGDFSKLWRSAGSGAAELTNPQFRTAIDAINRKLPKDLKLGTHEALRKVLNKSRRK
jgi:hypothetical protein